MPLMLKNNLSFLLRRLPLRNYKHFFINTYLRGMGVGAGMLHVTGNVTPAPNVTPVTGPQRTLKCLL